MALGRGLVAIWHELKPGSEADFIAWPHREHMPERLGIPGFFRGRRGRAVAARPEWVTLYETESAATLAGPDYIARLNNPTEWTRRAVPNLTHGARTLAVVQAKGGHGAGGFTLALGFDVEDAKAGALRSWLVDEALPRLLASDGIAGWVLARADTAASAVKTEEKKGRDDKVPEWVLLVEATGRGALDRAMAEVGEAALAARGARDFLGGGYQLMFLLSDSEAG